MTDVRLTALNPADSQVYPVACNDKGELILEQTNAGYWSRTGTTLSPATVGDSTEVGSSSGAKTLVDGDGIYQFQTNGTDIGCMFLANGSATFAATITSQSWPTKGYSIENDANGGAIGINQVLGASGIAFVVSTGGTQVASVTALGAATFAGNVTGATFISPQTSGNSTRFKIISTSGVDAVVMDQAGSATFAGDIESSGAGLGVIIKSPNGTRYRLTVDDSGNLSTTAI